MYGGEGGGGGGGGRPLYELARAGFLELARLG